MILPQRSFSETVKAANCSGLIGLGDQPVASSRDLDVGHCCDDRDVVVDLLHDLARRTLGHVVAGPGREQHAGVARLGRGRQVGQRRIAFGVGDEQAPERPAIDRDLGVDRIDHHEAQQPALQVGDGLRVALVADIDRLDAGLHLVQFRRHARGQGAGAEIVLHGIGLELRRQLGRRPDRAVGVDQQHEGRRAHARDRLEAVDRIVGQLVVDRGVDRLRHRRGGENREPVGPGARHRFGRRDAIAAAPVVDHDGLTPHCRELLRIKPRTDIGRGPGRKRHDHGHAAGRKFCARTTDGAASVAAPARNELSPAEHVSSMPSLLCPKIVPGPGNCPPYIDIIRITKWPCRYDRTRAAGFLFAATRRAAARPARAQVDQLVRFVEQPLRHAPEGEVYRGALLLVVERRRGLRFPERRAIVLIDPEVKHVLRHHPEHHATAEHAGLAEHPAHGDAADRRELLAQEFGKAVAGDHPPILGGPGSEFKAAFASRPRSS